VIVKPKKGKVARRDRASSQADEPKYVLRLYVTGLTPNSTRAIANIKEVCGSYLANRYDLQVLDIYQHPKLAAKEQIIAAPTLIKKLPLPLRRLVGDLSEKDRVLAGLELQAASE
jgi:circadian clock protein KaiB